MTFSLYIALGFAIGISILVYGLRRKKKGLIIVSLIILAVLILGIVILANALGNM
jgi:hypothetical protein